MPQLMSITELSEPVTSLNDANVKLLNMFGVDCRRYEKDGKYITSFCVFVNAEKLEVFLWYCDLKADDHSTEPEVLVYEATRESKLKTLELLGLADTVSVVSASYCQAADQIAKLEVTFEPQAVKMLENLQPLNFKRLL